jgi:hypothetical protein
VQEHSLNSGADGEANPVAALPGLVLAPGVVKAVVAFMAAENPAQVGGVCSSRVQGAEPQPGWTAGCLCRLCCGGWGKCIKVQVDMAGVQRLHC